jgi:DNA-binding CsgD family transcriptional regulator
MAAAGQSNRDIAQALFVTVKAVEWHLGHAYRKLGVRSRKELKTAVRAHVTVPCSLGVGSDRLDWHARLGSAS